MAAYVLHMSSWASNDAKSWSSVLILVASQKPVQMLGYTLG
jgi:hypothetical protein